MDALNLKAALTPLTGRSDKDAHYIQWENTQVEVVLCCGLLGECPSQFGILVFFQEKTCICAWCFHCVSLALLIVRFKALESMRCYLCKLPVQAEQNPQLYNQQ